MTAGPLIHQRLLHALDTVADFEKVVAVIRLSLAHGRLVDARGNGECDGGHPRLSARGATRLGKATEPDIVTEVHAIRLFLANPARLEPAG